MPASCDDLPFPAPFHVAVGESTTLFYVVEQHVNHYLTKIDRQHDVEGRRKPGLWTTDQLLSNTNYFANFPFLCADSPAAECPAVQEAVYAMKVLSEESTLKAKTRDAAWFRSQFGDWFIPRWATKDGSVLQAFDEAVKHQDESENAEAGLEAARTLQAIRCQVAAEIDFYEGLRALFGGASDEMRMHNVLQTYRKLLPAWILRQELCDPLAPNLYGLGLWERGGAYGDDGTWDEGSPLGCLLDDLLRCLSYDADSMGDYRACVMSEYEEYQHAYEHRDAELDRARFSLGVPELYELLWEEEVQPAPWVEHKANLIWNFVVCPLFGVAHRLPAETGDPTSTAPDFPSFSWGEDALGIGSGQVPVVQLKSEVCEESTGGRLDLSSRSQARGLVMLFGSRYDASYWEPLEALMCEAVEGFFAWDGGAVRAHLHETAQSFFSERRMRDIRAMLRDAGDSLPAAEREAQVEALPYALVAALDRQYRTYCEHHARSLIKSEPNPQPEDPYPALGAAVDAARREFVAGLPKGVRISEDLDRALSAAVTELFDRELGATERDGAQGANLGESGLFTRIFGAIDAFFEARGDTPCASMAREHMRCHLLDWRKSNRKSIDIDTLNEAVSCAIGAAVAEEQRVFFATGPGNVPGGKPINSRRHFALSVEDGRLMMRDLGSHNGSFVIRRGAGGAAGAGSAAGADSQTAGAAGTVYVFEGASRSRSTCVPARELAKQLGFACVVVGPEGLQAHRGDELIIGRLSRFQIG